MTPPPPTSKPASKPKPPAPGHPTPPADARLSVRVRMYRQGFGDCFLLTFTEGARTTHAMIDCGVHASHPGGPTLIKKAAEHIAKETQGKLAVLAVTHEHWDHVSGFEHAKDTFKKFEIQQSWSAWTENPQDNDANQIREHARKARVALHAALTRLRATARGQSEPAARLALDERVTGLEGLMGFSGPLGAEGGDGGKVSAAMNWAARSGKKTLYLNPFQAPVGIPGVDGVRVFVLGPPKSEAALDSDDPRAGEGYALAAAAEDLGAMSAAIGAAASRRGTVRSVEIHDPLTPFAQDHWRMASPKTVAPFPSAYTQQDAGWRRIDGTWANSAEDLALALDDHTNNTSLVLAFQLPKSGKVLLFAGDAQAGNWRSWHDRPFAGSGAGPAVAARDLLRDTVLYKVSHHGSVNATMGAQGLELMTNPELVAMLPLYMDPLGKRWKMPGPRLYSRLCEQTRGRVIWADPRPPKELEPKLTKLSAAELNRFTSAVRQDDLFVEYTVVDGE